MKRLTLIVIVGLVAVLLAACGGGEASSPEPTSVTVQGYDEFRFEPEDVSAEAGGEVTLTLENEGALEHSWVLVPENVDAVEATQEDAIAGANTGNIAGGESATITFTAPPAGTYTIVCTVPGHAAGGMVGTFTSQ